MKRAAFLLAFVAACTSSPIGPPDLLFTQDDLARMVLQEADAPVGTTYVDGNSGFLGLDRIAEDDAERAALEDAGFVIGYLAIFFDETLYEPERLNPDGSLALSFALMFEDRAGAAEGLAVLSADVLADGEDLDLRPTDTLGDGAFAAYGLLDPDEPPGFLFAWRSGNVVQMLVTAGARDAIREDATRILVRQMIARARARPPQGTNSPTT